MIPNLYPEMDAQIVRILRIGNNPARLYAAARIEQLEREIAAERERADVAERAAPCHSRPSCYVAQDDHGGWYGDAAGMIEGGDGEPWTKEQALEWVIARINHVSKQTCPIFGDYREWMAKARKAKKERDAALRRASEVERLLAEAMVQDGVTDDEFGYHCIFCGASKEGIFNVTVEHAADCLTIRAAAAIRAAATGEGEEEE